MAEAKRDAIKNEGRGLDNLICLNDIVDSIASTSGCPDETKITMDLQTALEPQIPVRPKNIGWTHGYYFKENHKVVSRQSVN
jgi:hypothetical protein